MSGQKPLFVLYGENRFSTKMSIIKEIEDKIAPFVELEGMEVVDVQYVSEHGRKVLRIFLDKLGGVTLQDCEEMSGKLGELIDESNIIHESYVLEVSSPGLDRVLKKSKDFIRFTGSKARISLYAPLDGQRNFLGRIISVNNDIIEIEDVSGRRAKIPISSMAKARLEPDI